LVDTLNDMLARLEQSFESQRHFTADASHELRSPLSRLRAELEVTLRRPRVMAEYVDTLRSCLDEVERLTQLVDELLTLARLDASQERAPVEPVDLNSIAEDAVRRFAPVARAQQVQLVLSPSPVVSAQVTHGHMSLVLVNLLDNAVKFSPAGGTVTIDLDSNGSDAVLSVSDVGPGIEPEELSRIFERFYRGASARSSEVAGAGLGLAVSQAIVRAYRGQIEASKLPNGGARFTVRLPLSQAESVPNSRLQHMPSEDHAKDQRYGQRETHAER
jgi:two-component system, OmpR family, sensor kinase